jgi:hypothetical protein
MKTIFQFGLPRQVAGLLPLLYCLAVSDGRAADAPAVPPEGSAPEAILSQARHGPWRCPDPRIPTLFLFPA